MLFEAIRRMLSEQVYDVIDATRQALADHGACSADDVRRLPPLVRFSSAMRADVLGLKRFLRLHLYRHPQVVETTSRGKQVVRELFDAYLAAPDEMPPDYADALDLHRTVADYIAGMTDRFAIREHERLTGRSVF